MNSTIEISLPSQLLSKVQKLINDGLFKDLNDFFETAGNYYLERHTDEMWETYVEHEIKAGLNAEYI
jgi:Arc/MetJ-type ribon-helix-helix transcriptional regulator